MHREVIALTNLRAVCACVVHIDRAFDTGNEAGARDALRQLAGEVGPALGRITADLEAAKAMDLTQHTLARFFARDAQPHPHAANDEQATTPTQPAPSLA